MRTETRVTRAMFSTLPTPPGPLPAQRSAAATSDAGAQLGRPYPSRVSSSVAGVRWVAAHDANSARLSVVGVPAGAV